MPLEQTGQPLTFYAFFVASKQGLSGLSVTTDVYRINTSAAATQVVTNANATEVGGGLYLYQLNSTQVIVEGEYIAVFKTANTTADMQHIPAIWVVQKAGVEYLDASITSRPSATDYTSARATLLDNLDATVSSRVSSSNITSMQADITAIKVPVLSYLDTTISSRVSSSAITTLSTDITTILGRVDVNVSTRASATDWTSARAAYLDAAISSRSVLVASDVWNSQTSGMTTSGSIGKRIVDNLDSPISGVGSSTLTAAQVWDYLTSNTTTVGSIGKRLSDNIDSTISSRLSASSYVAPDNANIATILSRTDVATSTRASASDWTTSRAVKIDNLDVAVSSRTDSSVWTGTKAGYLDIAISSRLSAAGYTAPDNTSISTILGRVDVATSTRSTSAEIWNYASSSANTANSIGKQLVDNLDVVVSTRLSTAGYTAPDNAGISTISGRLTSTRAGYLDNLTNLDVLVSSRLSSASYVAPDNSSIASALTNTSTLTSRLTSTRANNLDNLDALVSTRSTNSGVWDYATSSLTTAGSIGKRISDNIDATISSRLASASYTAPDNTTIANIYARTDVATSTRSTLTAANVWDYSTSNTIIASSIGKRIADNLDTTISSRLATSGYTAPDNSTISTISSRLTATRAGYLDNLTNLDATISSRTDSATWTSVRAGYLDVAISSRLASSSYSSPPTVANIWDAQTSGLTTAGSVGKRLADNIDTQISTRLATSGYTAPDNAGITTISGRLTATRAGYLDLLPTINTTNSGITSLQADVTAIKTPVQSYIDASISSRASGSDYTSSRASKLDYLDANISSRLAPSGITSLEANVSEIRVPILLYLDTAISSRFAASQWVAPDNATISTILSRTDVATSTRASASYYTSARALKIDYLDDAISSRLSAASFVSAPTINDIWNVASNSLTTVGSLGKLLVDYVDAPISTRVTFGEGSTIFEVLVTETDQVTPIEGVACWVTTDYAGSNLIAGTLYTTQSGYVTFYLDPGSYYIWRQRSGWNFANPQQITVT